MSGALVLWREGTTRPAQSSAARAALNCITGICFQILVLNDVWHPWWRARVGGKPADILKANVLFRAVVVPPGRQVVRFSFQPFAGALAQLRAKFSAALKSWNTMSGVLISQWTKRAGQVRQAGVNPERQRIPFRQSQQFQAKTPMINSEVTARSANDGSGIHLGHLLGHDTDIDRVNPPLD